MKIYKCKEDDKMNVIIIEEDPMVREVILEYIKEVNSVSKVYTSNDIDISKEKLLSGMYQLLILDIKSYNNIGISILREIRDKIIDIEVLVISSESNINVIKNINRYGIADYILKPFSRSRLKKSIKRINCQIEVLKTYKYINQDDIDRIYGKKYNCDNENTRGINTETYAKIFQVVKKQTSPFTTKHITNNISLSRITVRRYLEYMKDKDVLVLDQQYGKVGRPIRYYRLKESKL
ncbi:response regulator [Mycoplasmatota bacterium]|nr:response regulator [Mycoplasmatota bacterium]